MNANAYKMAFWLLAHIIFNPSLLSSIREEMAPAIKSQDIDIEFLVSETHCPLINATFNETLRYTSAATSGRVVLAPTTIGNHHILYPGAKVLMPYRLNHFDEKVFGPNPMDFDPQRFLRNGELVKHPAFRPFGGGSQYCSGRFLARREVIGFLVFVLHRFDLDLSGTVDDGASELGAQIRFPRQDVNTPNLGIISPVPGDEIRVAIRRRVRV